MLVLVLTLSVCLSLLATGCAQRACTDAPDAVVNESGAGGEAGAQTDTASATTPDDGAGTPAAEVRPIAAAERRAAPTGTAEITLLARGANAFLGRLEMVAGAAVPEHRDPTEEYIHVLEGTGTIWIDDVESRVEPGTTIFMPANARVRFQNGPDARMVAIQVFAGPEPAAKYDAWQPRAGE